MGFDLLVFFVIEKTRIVFAQIMSSYFCIRSLISVYDVQFPAGVCLYVNERWRSSTGSLQ